MEKQATDQFLKQIAHDLAAPLSALQIISENMQDRDYQPLLEESLARLLQILERIEAQTQSN